MCVCVCAYFLYINLCLGQFFFKEKHFKEIHVKQVETVFKIYLILSFPHLNFNLVAEILKRINCECTIGAINHFTCKNPSFHST